MPRKWKAQVMSWGWIFSKFSINIYIYIYIYYTIVEKI